MRLLLGPGYSITISKLLTSLQTQLVIIMAKIIDGFLTVLLCMLISSCTTHHPSGNVQEDAEYIVSEIINRAESFDTVKLNKILSEHQSFYGNRKASKLEFYGRVLQLFGTNVNPSYNSDNAELNNRLSLFLQSNASNDYLRKILYEFGKQYMLAFISDNYSGVAQNDAAMAANFIQFAYAIGASNDLFNFYVDKYQHNTAEEAYTFCNLIQATNYTDQSPRLMELYMSAHSQLIDKYKNGQLDASRYPDLYRIIGNMSEVQTSLHEAAQNFNPDSL